MRNFDRLRVQKNGMIVHEYRRPGVLGVKSAGEVKFSLEYKSNMGWHSMGEFVDELTARQCFREANPSFKWRLVAFNEIGRVRIPANWKGYRC